MNLLFKLTIKNLKLNKKRTIVTIVGIVLSVALITAVATMYLSTIASLIDFEVGERGNFHVAFYDVPIEEVDKFYNNRKIDKVFLTKDEGYTILKESKNVDKPYAFVKSFSKASLNNLSVKLVDGRLPRNDKEIIIPTHLKTNGRVDYRVGQTINLQVGKRMSDGYEMHQENPYVVEGNEKIVDTILKTYKIVGIIERPATNIEGYTAPGYTFITYEDDLDKYVVDDNSNKDTKIETNRKLEDNKLNIYVRLTKKGLKNKEKFLSGILNIDESILKIGNQKNPDEKQLKKFNEEMEKAKYRVDLNSYLIQLETNPLGEESMGSLGIVVFVVCLIIVFTSVFCIKNSFDISITEKIKQYGMLRSVGATKKQIKNNVIFESFILSLIGIPIGILVGLLASFILIKVSNYYMIDMIDSEEILRLDISWIAIIFAVILGIITMYFSALSSARRAAKVSTIDSIRNSGQIKISAKKLKSSKIIKKIFGVGGEISYKNLKRNRKKYRTTVISMVVSVFVFIALYSFMSLAFKTIDVEVSYSDYDLQLYTNSHGDKLMRNKVMDTVKLDNVEDYTFCKQLLISIKDVKINSEYVKKKKNGYEDKGGYIEVNGVDGSEGVALVSALGEHQYKKYIKELGLDYDEVKEKGILFDTHTIGKYNKTKKKKIYHTMREFTYNNGDVLTTKIYDESEEETQEDKATDEKDNVDKDKDSNKENHIEIGYITDKKPFGFKNNANSMLFISDEMFDKYYKHTVYYDYIEIFFKSSNPNKLQDDIDAALNGYDYSLNNISDNVKMMDNLYTLIAIFLYGFIIVISLIGVTNIFNTITTNMELRKQEFAMLKSVGMTSKEFNRMIRLESIFMGTKSLVIGVPIGIVLSYLIYYYLAKDMGISYSLPLIAILISVLAVFLLITCIMKYSISKINKQNTIETIRNENI